MEYFIYLDNMIRQDARWPREVKPAKPWQKQHSTGIRLFTSQLD
jgi:hypothetical protein